MWVHVDAECNPTGEAAMAPDLPRRRAGAEQPHGAWLACAVTVVAVVLAGCASRTAQAARKQVAHSSPVASVASTTGLLASMLASPQDSPTSANSAPESAQPASSNASSPDGSTIQMGDLTVTPHTPNPTECADLFHAGEAIDVSGDGYAAGASVTLALSSSLPKPTTQIIHADKGGDIFATIQLSAGFRGRPFPGGGEIAYVEADGAGASATQEEDNAIISVGTGDATCGVPPIVGGSVTVEALGEGAESVPTTGATFAISGPGLPPLTTAAPTIGTYAALVIGKDGGAACATPEPRGVDCFGGVIDDLKTGATYTATETVPPALFAVAPPQTFVASDQGGTAGLFFEDPYIGPPLTARVGITLLIDDPSVLDTPPGGVFALTGPGLPPLTGNPPTPGSFAELDMGQFLETTCSDHEPPGVVCEDGVISGLAAGASYTVTELSAPQGFAISPPQQFDAETDGGTTDIEMTNQRS